MENTYTGEIESVSSAEIPPFSDQSLTYQANSQSLFAITSNLTPEHSKPASSPEAAECGPNAPQFKAKKRANLIQEVYVVAGKFEGLDLGELVGGEGGHNLAQFGERLVQALRSVTFSDIR